MSGGGAMSTKSLKILLVLAVLMFTTSCTSMDCAYDIKIHPNPIFLSVEEGILFGTNYSACFLIDGVIHKEHIPECAYKYYKKNQ
jgi:hypothetical protein